MAIGAGIFEEMQARNELARQDQQRRKEEKSHSRNWWKRGVGQGLLGAIPGIVTLNPIQAIAGAAGGFGGESVNHFAFKDKHPEIAGNAAALASLGSGAASKGLFSQAADKVGLDGLQRTAGNMGNNAAYNAEIAKAGSFGPGATLESGRSIAGPAMPQGQFDHPALAQSGGATHPAVSTESMGPSTMGANPRDLAFGQVSSDMENLTPEELMRRHQMMFGLDSNQSFG
jgi:hypothetical protein